MDDQQIIQIYNDEYVQQHIGFTTLNKKYHHNFYPDIHRLNLELRNNQEKGRKFSCDVDYFKNIDTEEKAYWLGFLFADGYISSVGKNEVKRFGISISEVDYNHLEKFKKAIKSDALISHYVVTNGYKPGVEYCRLIIQNDDFAKNLISQGCVEHKTDILNPPDIPKQLEKHFIRGLMDGDGSIVVNQSKYGPSYSISFVSTDSVLNWVLDHLLDNDIIQRKYPISKRKPEQIVSYISFGGNFLQKKYLDYIYDGATVWLERKHEKYLDLCRIIQEKTNNKGRISY